MVFGEPFTGPKLSKPKPKQTEQPQPTLERHSSGQKRRHAGKTQSRRRKFPPKATELELEIWQLDIYRGRKTQGIKKLMAEIAESGKVESIRVRPYFREKVVEGEVLKFAPVDADSRRRLRAYQLLGWTKIPVSVVVDPPEHER